MILLKIPHYIMMVVHTVLVLEVVSIVSLSTVLITITKSIVLLSVVS